MTEIKSTKRAFLASLVALMLCIAMLLGTTYAWFTDSVTSGRNMIQSGNLDVVLEFSTDGKTWDKVTEESPVFEEKSLWEPGHTECVALRVTNAGSLALSYDLATTIYQETKGINVFDNEFKLSDYIDVYYGTPETASEVSAILASREAATGENVQKGEFNTSLATNSQMLPGVSEFVVLTIQMPETVGNDANYKTGTEAPSVQFGINLLATQTPYEADSFDENYDVEAKLDGLDKVSDGLYWDDESKTYTVSNGNGLKAINNFMATGTYSLKQSKDFNAIELAADIDFSGETWTPVDLHADKALKSLSMIDGNGHTISNLTVNGQAMFTRFAGSADTVTVKDLTFDNANVNSTTLNTSILTVQSYQNVVLDNVDVKNSFVTGTYKVAPLIATMYDEKPGTNKSLVLRNCDVTNTTVKATRYDFCTSGMVAFVYASDGETISFENCTVSGVKLVAPDDNYDAHAFVYTTGSDVLFDEADGVTVTNCTFEVLN